MATNPAAQIAPSVITSIPGITGDQRFLFDTVGYLHLRGAMAGDEVAESLRRIDALAGTDLAAFNADRPDGMAKQLNRPFSRILDLDPWFLRFLDHPASCGFLPEFLGPDYRHIDNDVLYTIPGYPGGGWHRGVSRHDTGHMRGGAFLCPMVKVFHCLTDVGPGGGAFVVVPGSHKSNVDIPIDRADLPGQHVFDDVHAGDFIIFNEAVLHNGTANRSAATRKTLIVNFGRADAGVWEGYAPADRTFAAATPRQRRILDNRDHAWTEPSIP
ncbi:MAG: phytanoyl-CoA dioxygenase family protein [Planctomycetes bacterium]|nr:phytanoyl-CoA dioxygenase family protein [Planctomycetota bacterium]